MIKSCVAEKRERDWLCAAELMLGVIETSLGLNPPTPCVFRLVAACNHGDNWSSYLLRGGEGGELVTLYLGLLEGGRAGGERGGGLHTKTTLFSAHPFTAWAASKGNKINSMKELIRVTRYYDLSFRAAFKLSWGWPCQAVSLCLSLT